MPNYDNIKPSKRFYTYHRRLFITVWTRYNRYINEHDNSQPWHCLEERYVFVGCNPKLHGWFKAASNYYDGHTINYITVFGVTLGYGYTYEAMPAIG